MIRTTLSRVIIPMGRGMPAQQERLQNAANFSTLKMLVLLEEMTGPEAAERARQEAQEYTDWIKADVAKKYK